MSTFAQFLKSKKYYGINLSFNGVVNGNNTVFDLPAKYDTVRVFQNGLRVSGDDFGLSVVNNKTRVTFYTAPAQGDVLVFDGLKTPTQDVISDDNLDNQVGNNNRTFTLTENPVDGESLAVYWNGVRMIEGVDYDANIANSQFTFVQGNTPQSGDTVRVDYRKESQYGALTMNRLTRQIIHAVTVEEPTDENPDGQTVTFHFNSSGNFSLEALYQNGLRMKPEAVDYTYNSPNAITMNIAPPGGDILFSDLVLG